MVGGGISGLATAYLLRRRLGPDHPVTVLDSADRVGGKVNTATVAGLPVDTGPDSFLSRSPALRALIDDLGLAGDVVEPAQSGAYVWSRGKLRPLPAGASFGLPERLWPLLRSGLLSPIGVGRAGLDLVLPTTEPGPDPTVEDLVRPRFGWEVYQRLVEPLLGGVHAGDAAELSARSAVPEVAGMAGAGRSMYLTMRRRRPARADRTAKRPAPLVSLDQGMGRLTEALADALGSAVRTGVTVKSVTPGPEGLVLVGTDGDQLTAQDLVLAAPAWAVADMLDTARPMAATLLREIPYVGVANATLAFRTADVPALPPGTGFLVPPVEQEFIVGCSWLSNKWPHLVQPDTVIVKAMVGRRGDDRWQQMDDADLTARVRDDLARMLGIRAEPIDALVQRWPRALPQYTVGHADRLDGIESDLAGLGRVHLAGAAYRGVGLAGCVTQASTTADRIAAQPS